MYDAGNLRVITDDIILTWAHILIYHHVDTPTQVMLKCESRDMKEWIQNM